MPPRRVGEGDRERLLYDLSKGHRLRVKGSNLTFSCQDTYSATQNGCGAPVPDPVEPIKPIEHLDLVLAQSGHIWRLGQVNDIGPDLTAQIEVQLPRAVRRGRAVLSLLERPSGSGPRLDVVIS